MTLESIDAKLRYYLQLADLHKVQARDIGEKTLRRCARSVEHHAVMQEQLFRTSRGLRESHGSLRRLNAMLGLEVAKSDAALDQIIRSPAAGDFAPRQAQVAVHVLVPPRGREWVHEIKQDGYRLLCRREGETVSILDSDGRDWNRFFPALVEAVLALKVTNVIIDGDAIVLNSDGFSSRACIDDAIHSGDDGTVLFLAFDLLSLNGELIASQPLTERKERLRRLMRGGDESKIRYAPHLRQDGNKMLQQAYLLGVEGIVSKRGDAPYRTGLGLDWQMTKCVRRH